MNDDGIADSAATQSREFTALYRQHYNRLYTLAFRLTGTTENAEDVLQTAFLEAFRALPAFRGESTSYTWLYRIVLNTSRSLWAERGRMPTDEYAESHQLSLEAVYRHINGFGNAEEAVLLERVRESCLQMFMNCMPVKYRTVYTLRGMLQFSVRDTAEILGITEDSVKTRFHRARQIAQTHLAGRCALVKPGAMCHCRGFAGYVQTNRRESRLQNVKVVRRLEVMASREYENEMREILEVDRLFATELTGIDYAVFKKRIKGLLRDNQFTLLSR
jgi:RNA polymerase sigma factor (sigma-70 family)